MSSENFGACADRLVEETLDSLRNKPVNSTPLERWVLLDRATSLYDGLPQPLKMGKTLQYMVENATLPVREYDLLLGRFFEIIPSDEEESVLRQIAQREAQRGSVMAPNYGHLTLDWPHLLEYGITGYIERAGRRLEELRAAGAEEERVVFMEGMLLCYRSCLRYIERYAEAAEKAGLSQPAAVAKALCSRPPETFREALQLELFVLNWYYIYGGGFVVTLSFGRMDDQLFSYYEADLNAGRLTKEQARALITDFYCRTNMVLGRGEHQMCDFGDDGNTTGWSRNHCYDSPTYVVLGGYSNRRSGSDNELTALFAECIVPRFENPVIIFRRTKQTDPAIWDVLCDRLRCNASIIVYNDETQIASFEHMGVEHADAVDYTMHACNWPDIPAGYYVADYIGGPIPKMIMHALYRDGRPTQDFASVDELYARVEREFRESVRSVFAVYRDRYRSGKDPAPQELSLSDCFTDNVIERAQNMLNGGVKYPVIYALIRNIGTAADMMTALDKLVFREKKVTLERMCKALEADFQGYEDVLALCRNAPKFGTDCDEADGHAVRMMSMLLDVIDRESVNDRGERDVISLNVTITDMRHIEEGASLIATPDGRRCGAPLSENLSPSAGVGESVTALLNSVAKLPFSRIQAGAFNVRLNKNLVSGAQGLERIKILSEVFFENGGMSLQYSVADTEDLRAAQRDPDRYRDLMVRITGYSAVFVDMATGAQEEIIRRDEMA